MYSNLIRAILLVFFFGVVSCLKLLVVFPAPARSHYFLANELSKGLANLGHEVTLVAPYSEPNPPKNFREIVTKKRLELDKKKNMFDVENISPLLQPFFLNGISDTIVEPFFKSVEVQALLQSNETFDAVIVEQFLCDAVNTLAYHFKAHLIIFSTTGSNGWINNLVANPAPPSYVPELFMSFSNELSFTERAYNLIFSFISDMNLHFILYPKQASYVKKYFPNAPAFNEILYNISLVLLNSHESFNQPVPRVPNMIDIGGYHVNPPKQLPKDLQNFMDNAKDGVIYFSMGSNLKPSQIPKQTKDIILKVLGSRKENILWKWDEDFLENKPKNVKISKWFPQQGILAHPNCKLFITHGGFLSTTEAVTMGVPMLAFPVFGDQKLNAAQAAALGFGKTLPISCLTEKVLISTLEEMLSNPKYRDNVTADSGSPCKTN